ncbi:NADH-quinone oxidoreductase subunit A [Kibdelosporangium philippinense]|uniref:NADH-quinone oxidoreductase subunit A n=1 Tax=Kibdelosporangium philippinense TaxID=211113 RepID=A0ABS8ZCQ7_9PSEU|nr:NADH-quinone oxidoreductase subunit A [Kibdelosporangium philippinense]MCE7005639.1 NADH-quinone oxidoreductase subunit A [Kibdelosporangium philippinense]
MVGGVGVVAQTELAQTLAQSGSSELGSYLPLVFLLALGALFAGVSATLGALVGPKRYNKAKLEAYECGIEPSPQPVVGGGRVPVAYYLTAMLFILFDIEMVFLYPFAVTADALGVFGLVEIVLFIATVGFAYAYVWRRGGLDWN